MYPLQLNTSERKAEHRCQAAEEKLITGQELPWGHQRNLFDHIDLALELLLQSNARLFKCRILTDMGLLLSLMQR